MKQHIAKALQCALASTLCLPVAALAATPAATPKPDTIAISAETQELSRDFGSLRTVKLEYTKILEDTTIVAAPVTGFRETAAGTVTSAGGGVQLYRDWNDKVSTRTAIFVSEDKPVFARMDIAQDVSVNVARQLTLTVGARWAEYHGGEQVLFISGGLRRYFRGGSIAYRLAYTKPKSGSGYFAHLVNLSVNDRTGRGKTQLWLSAGNSSIERSQLENNFSGDDYGAMLRRVQPLGRDIDLMVTAGLSSYDHPNGRVWGKSVGLGLSFRL